MFARSSACCGVKPGDACAVLSETPTRPELPQLAELALARLGARPFQLVLPARPLGAPVPVRSTGASDAIGQLEPVVQALAASVFVADCTVEGLQHAVELPRILGGGARVLAISHEHPEILERCLPRAEDEAAVRDAMRRLKGAREMTSLPTPAPNCASRWPARASVASGASPPGRERCRTGPAGWCWPSRRPAA